MKYFLLFLITTGVVIAFYFSTSIIPMFAQSNSTNNNYYENPFLGIKLQYPNSWEKVNPSSFENNNCNIFGCITIFNLKENDENKTTDSYFSIRAYDFDTIKDECKCSNLIDFMIWKYELLNNTPGFLFFDDSKLILPGNNSAWVIEYLSLSNTAGFNYNYDVAVQYFEKFYDIRFESDSKEYFKQNIASIKNVINSIEFMELNQNLEQPSFLIQ